MSQYPFLGLGFNSWTQKFGRDAEAALKLVVGAFFQDSYRGAAFIFDADGTNPIKVVSSDTSTFDEFALSVAIGNSKIAAGMLGADDGGDASGSAFIYDLDGTNEVKLTASDAAAGDRFGSAVAIGNSKVAVGAKNEGTGGAVYVYNLDGTGEVKITPSDTASSDEFGRSVAIGNNKLYVGSPQDDDGGSDSGSVYIYNLDGTGESKLTPSDGRSFARFGNALAFGHDKIVVGAYTDSPAGSPAGGSVYVYDADGTNEVKIRSSDIATSDDFGHAVAIGSNKIVVGAPTDDDGASNTGSVYVYNLDGTGEVKITASDAAQDNKFGAAVAVGGNKIYVGAAFGDDTGTTNNSGSMYIYNLDGTGEVKIPNPEGDSNARFGASMALG